MKKKREGGCKKKRVKDSIHGEEGVPSWVRVVSMK